MMLPGTEICLLGATELTSWWVRKTGNTLSIEQRLRLAGWLALFHLFFLPSV